MKKFVVFAAMAALVAGLVFVACKKENSNVDETIIKQGIKHHKTLYIAQWTDRFKGEGSGMNKTCSATGNCCVIWFRTSIADSIDHYIGISLEIKSIVTCDPTTTNFPRNIILDFPYSMNSQEVLSNNSLFNFDSQTFIIPEDLEESGDSGLLDLLETTSDCVIPAGNYPFTISENGIQVVVPVLTE